MRSATAHRPHEVAPSTEPVTATARRQALLVQPNDARPTQPLWEPVPRGSGQIPTTTEVLASPCKPSVPPEVEQALLAVLTRPVAPGETHQNDGNAREHELRRYFDLLSPMEAYALRRRLDVARTDDKLVIAFRRLIIERRTRLQAFLADPRRGR